MIDDLELPTAEQARLLRDNPHAPLSAIFGYGPNGSSSVERDQDHHVVAVQDLSPIGDKVDETAMRAEALGIDVPLGEVFACKLPGHDDEARLHPTRRGYWCYSCPGVHTGFGLAEVRAAFAYRRVHRLSRIEAARWRERLDYEAGLIEPRRVALTLPERPTRAAVTVADGIRLYLGLRDELWASDDPFVFARSFAAAWCGVSEDAVRDGMRDLAKAGCVKRAGMQGRAILWVVAS